MHPALGDGEFSSRQNWHGSCSRAFRSDKLRSFRGPHNGFVGINGTWRSDFSTKYTKSKPINYPAADAYVDIKRIAFGNSAAISAFRLTAGWGNAGREEYIPYELLGNYLVSYPSVDRGTEVFYDGLNRLYSTEWNVGVELGLASVLDVKPLVIV